MQPVAVADRVHRVFPSPEHQRRHVDRARPILGPCGTYSRPAAFQQVGKVQRHAEGRLRADVVADHDGAAVPEIPRMSVATLRLS